MGKTAEREKLIGVLNSHLNTIHETLHMLDQTASSSLEKVSWDDVVKMGDQVSKQATIVGMLWTGDMPDAKALEENMAAYFNVLQGFLLLSHGSTVGAGPTLLSNVHAAIKHIVDSSFKLMTDSITSYGSNDKTQKIPIPQLVGTVWEACSALKKTPATNISAIGRAMTRVAVSVKDVLREMNELKPALSDDAPGDDASSAMECMSNDGEMLSDDDFGNDLGNDLSPEEMKIAQSAIEVVSAMLVVIKELIRSVSSLIKLENRKEKSNFVSSLEKLLKLCQDSGAQIDELGACLYPPQEIQTMKAALDKISSIIDDAQREIESLNGTTEGFMQSCNNLKNSVIRLNSELDSSTVTNLEAKLQDIAISA